MSSTIIVENLYKKFDLDLRSNDSALSNLLCFFSRSKSRRVLPVLKGISFKANAGEVIGVIGRNGSGKSTLLKIIAEIYLPDQGTVKTHGRVVYLAGLGQGLQSKLTLRENIYLVGSIMGLSSKDIGRKYDEIVDFSGLREFVDAKLYQFSSGMISRFAFSVTIHCVRHRNPEVLLLDEVFGTFADASFHEKAIHKMEELMKGGATIVITSHNMDFVEKFCHKALWIENGQIAAIGSSAESVKSYLSFVKASKK